MHPFRAAAVLCFCLVLGFVFASETDISSDIVEVGNENPDTMDVSCNRIASDSDNVLDDISDVRLEIENFKSFFTYSGLPSLENPANLSQRIGLYCTLFIALQLVLRGLSPLICYASRLAPFSLIKDLMFELLQIFWSLLTAELIFCMRYGKDSYEIYVNCVLLIFLCLLVSKRVIPKSLYDMMVGSAEMFFKKTA